MKKITTSIEKSSVELNKGDLFDEGELDRLNKTILVKERDLQILKNNLANYKKQQGTYEMKSNDKLAVEK